VRIVYHRPIHLEDLGPAERIAQVSFREIPQRIPPSNQVLVFLCRSLRRFGLGGLLGCRHRRETEDGQDEEMNWFHVISVDTGDLRPAKGLTRKISREAAAFCI
jgi:hypothetical protein